MLPIISWKKLTLDHVEEAALLVLGERFNRTSQNRNKINQMVQKAQEDISKKKEENQKGNTQDQGQNQRRKKSAG